MNQRQRLAFRHLIRKLYVGFFKRPAKAAHSIAVLPDIFAFRFIQDVANVSAGIAIRLDDADEILDQLLEKYVVFPERVVRIDQQCMASHRTWRSAAFTPRTASPRPRFPACSVYQSHGIFGDGRSGSRAASKKCSAPRSLCPGIGSMIAIARATKAFSRA